MSYKEWYAKFQGMAVIVQKVYEEAVQKNWRGWANLEVRYEEVEVQCWLEYLWGGEGVVPNSEFSFPVHWLDMSEEKLAPIVKSVVEHRCRVAEKQYRESQESYKANRRRILGLSKGELDV